MESLVCDLTNALNSNSSSAIIITKAKKKCLKATTSKRKMTGRQAHEQSSVSGRLTNAATLASNKRNTTKSQVPENHTVSEFTGSSRVRRHNSLNNFSKSSSSSNLASRSKMNKHKRIMGLLLAARASISQMQQQSNEVTTETNTAAPTGCANATSNSELTNLVRIKPSALNKLNKELIRDQETEIKSTAGRSRQLKGVYKIQKTYRFHANYRLHCIRLRRMQKKHFKQRQRHHHRHHHNHHHHRHHHHHKTTIPATSTATASNSSMLVDGGLTAVVLADSHSSTISSSTTTATSDGHSTSSSELELSSTSTSSSSLNECYSMANLNIDTSDEAHSARFSLLRKPVSSKSKGNKLPAESRSKKLSKRRLLTFRHRRQQQQQQNLVGPVSGSGSGTLVGSSTAILAATVGRKKDVKTTSEACRRLKTPRTITEAGAIEVTNSGFKRGTSYKRKRINSSYSRVKRVHHGKDGLSTYKICERDDTDEDDDLTTDSAHSDYAESNEDKEASCDEKTFIRPKKVDTSEHHHGHYHSKSSSKEQRLKRQSSELMVKASDSFVGIESHDSSATAFELSDQAISQSFNKESPIRRKAVEGDDELPSGEDHSEGEADDDLLDDNVLENDAEFNDIVSGALSLMSEASRFIYRRKIRKIKCGSNTSHRKKRFNSFASDYAGPKSSTGVFEIKKVDGEPIPETNIGNRMLQSMGWEPGQSLGKSRSALTEPIVAVKRPNRLGFGYPETK